MHASTRGNEMANNLSPYSPQRDKQSGRVSARWSSSSADTVTEPSYAFPMPVIQQQRDLERALVSEETGPVYNPYQTYPQWRHELDVFQGATSDSNVISVPQPVKFI